MTGFVGFSGPRVLRFIGFGGFLAAAIAVGNAQQPAFRARTDVVSVAVSVMKGREPVVGLKAADFEITDNGVRQTVDDVATGHESIDVTLVLTPVQVDRSSGARDNFVSAEGTRRLLQSADRLRVIVVDDAVRGSVVAADYDVLTDSRIDKLRPVRGLFNGFSTVLNPGQTQNWAVSLTDGLFYALAWPIDPDRRHLVVAFTDGWDKDSTLEVQTLPNLAARSDAVLHVVSWATPGDGPSATLAMPPSSARVADRELREWEASFRPVDEAVRRTGGTLLRTTRAAEALAEIIADFRSSYILRYSPKGVALPGWHELGVKLTQSGSFKIRARKGYEGG